MDAPSSFGLDFTAQTVVAPAQVKLSPSYQGSFNLTSTNMQPAIVQVLQDVEDPRGEDRNRSVITQQIGGTCLGKVWWGNQKIDAILSHALVETSLSTVQLTL